VSEDGRQHFRLERASGRLVVAGRLDREELCGQAATCMLPFELLLSNPLQFFRVEVTLDDINDHSPVFPEERVTYKIVERSDPGSRFPLVGARDPDIGSNTVQEYSISPENEYFRLSYGSRTNDDKYLEIVLENPLDREEHAEMGFSVIAVDGGSPPRSGSIEISIIILDVNDNAPIFMQERYIGRVMENMPAGSVVLTVLATDQDAGVNGDIFYELSQSVVQADSAFVIDPITGEIKLTKPLDFEAAQYHDLIVRATDGGGLSAICKVLVEVVDVNDNAPELVLSSFSSPLPEDTVPGTVVALFSVRDRDSGANGKISCALEDQLSFSLRPAYKNYYELVTVSALDREETPQYILSVTAADAGSPPLAEGSGCVSLGAAPGGGGGKLGLKTMRSLLAAPSATHRLRLWRCEYDQLPTSLAHTSVVGPGPESTAARGAHVQSGLADAAAAGTLPRAYCYEISLTTGSGNSEFKFLRPILPSLPPQHCALGQGPAEEQDFPCVPVSTEDMAPDNAGTLSAGQLNALSFD
uniref:protocadherin beta-15-like n=1 Tax=Lonchura striata TaxID=40157 RepID=UPI001292D650